MQTDNLRDSQIKALMDRVRALETRSPLQSSSITSGRLRVGGTAILLVDSDGGIVVQGKLTGSGTLEWTQIVNLKGTTTITGPTTIDGLTRLTKALTVGTGGKILVEGPVAATLENGKLSFASGGELTSYAGGATLQATGVSSAVRVGTGSTALVFSSNQVLVSVDGTVVYGPMVTTSSLSVQGSITNSGMTAKTGVTANVHVDSAGRLWKVG